MSVSERPATIEDIERFSPMRNKPSLKAWCWELDGEIIAMGGVALINGRWLAFLDLTDKARPYKMKLARGAKRFFNELRDQGVKFTYAEVDRKEANAERWLKSLGFELDPRGRHLYRWRA